MAGRRICAGYYRRYDGKVVYVISTATDADTGEETVIWTSYPFADVPRYCTSSKKSFCAFVKVDGERKAKYKRQINMKISAAAIERLEDEGFRGPVRKRHRRQLDEEYDSREYQQSLTYHAYAMKRFVKCFFELLTQILVKARKCKVQRVCVLHFQLAGSGGCFFLMKLYH